MLPSSEELGTIALAPVPLHAARAWVGLSDAGWTKLCAMMGEFERVRDLAMTPRGPFGAALAQPPSDEAYQMTVVEMGQVGLLRQVARALVGLPPDLLDPPSQHDGRAGLPPGGQGQQLAVREDASEHVGDTGGGLEVYGLGSSGAETQLQRFG